MAEPRLTRWRNLWRRFGAASVLLGGTGTAIISAYQGMSRFYHATQHLDDVLSKLDWAKGALEASAETAALKAEEKQRLFDTIELALWYHDVVYDPKAKDNEAKSRDLFLVHAREYGLPEDVRKDVAALIDLTAHHGNANTLAERILVDCDLAILGAPAEEFEQYDQNIRKEYAHVPGPAYKRARRGVLKSFLDQPRIFKTEAFLQTYEETARRNLEKASKPAFSWKWGSFR